MYSPGSVVSCCGEPPCAEIFQSAPPNFSSHEANAMDFPSGDHAGEYSVAVKEDAVKRRGCPAGMSMSQMWPTAWNASDLPSGEAVCQRAKRIWNSSSVMRRSVLAICEIVRCTCAVNAIV